jgi:hypothetical protein
MNSNPLFKRMLPGKEAYHFPAGQTHESPCMNPFWRAQPIRQGNVRDLDEIFSDEKPNDELEED